MKLLCERATRASKSGDSPEITQEDLVGALEVIRPLSRSSTEELSIGSVTLDDVGDMVETKQALTEAVLWPLQHPDSFARLGVDPPRGVLLYGPPGCGKTYLVRALASSGHLSVHAVKGAELMDKWVGRLRKGRKRVVPARTRFGALVDLPRRNRRPCPASWSKFRLRGVGSRRSRVADRTPTASNRYATSWCWAPPIDRI